MEVFYCNISLVMSDIIWIKNLTIIISQFNKLTIGTIRDFFIKIFYKGNNNADLLRKILVRS